MTGKRYGIYRCRFSFMILMVLTGSTGVKITVESPVIVTLPASKLIIPCNYSTQAPNSDLCLIIWQRGLQNSSTIFSGYRGDVVNGPLYKDRAQLGSGCSCEVYNPNENDTDTYKVKLVCHEHDRFEDSEEIIVKIVRNEAPTTTMMLETSNSDGSTFGMMPTKEKEDTDSNSIIISVLVAGIIVIITISSAIFVICYRTKRRSRYDVRGATTELDAFLPISKKATTRTMKLKSKQYQAVCKAAETHVKTSLFDEVLDKLKTTNWLTLLGNPGDGTSTIFKQISLEYGRKHFFTVKINSVTEIRNYDFAGQRVLFVCDNPLVNVKSNEDAWRGIDEYLFLTSDNLKLLTSCRLDVWSQYKSVLERIAIYRNTVDVRSARLTDEDKMKMVHHHVGNIIPHKAKQLIVEKCNFAFPECCRFISQCVDNGDFSEANKLEEIYSSPVRFVQKQLEITESKNKLQYATLVLCLLNGGKIPKRITSEFLKQSHIELVRKLYMSDKTVEQLYDTLLDKAKEIDGWLLTQKEEHYEFYHQCISEAIRKVHGARYPDHVVTFS